MKSGMPKVLQPLAGIALLQHVVNCARATGAEDICVVYGHGGDQVQEAMQNESLRWAHQSEQKGTGHAVMQAMPETPDENRVLVLFGDVPLLRPATIEKLLSSGTPDEVAVLTVIHDNPFGYGRIVRDDGTVVKSVEEKDASQDEKRIREINTGVMCFSAVRLKQWLQNLGNNNAQGEYYLTDVIGMAVNDGVTVHGVIGDDTAEIMGINDKKQLAEAERALQKRRAEELMEQGVTLADPSRIDIRGSVTCGTDVFIDVNVVLEGDVHLGDNVRIESNNVIKQSQIGANTTVYPNCHIEDSTTGSDCNIGPFARLRPGNTLRDRVKVGNFVEIKNSDVNDGSKVNHLTYVGDSDIGRDVNIGAGTITCNYDGAHKHKTIIGDDVFVGSGVELVAPVEIEAGATIGAGSTISKSAPGGKLTVARAKQISVDGWKRPQKK